LVPFENWQHVLGFRHAPPKTNAISSVLDRPPRRARVKHHSLSKINDGASKMITPLLFACAVLLGGQVAVASTVCRLIVPANPLSAQGLATPYQLKAGCSMLVPGQETFVEGAVYDPFTNTVSIYNPLVIDQGTTAAILPVAPNLPDGAVVALWFGTNAGGLVLEGVDLAKANCVNGFTSSAPGSTLSAFGQFAYCNAPTFFANANNIILPDLGTASDGQPCLTTRDFALVDMDQS
jgi:hypothetical protein